MNEKMREIKCEEISDMEREFPHEIAVIREMLAEAGEQCMEEQTI